MRPFTLGQPLGNTLEAKIDWIIASLREIERISQEDATQIYDAYAVTGSFSTLRTFDASSATLTTLRTVFATLVSDFQARGVNRVEPT